VEPKQRKTIIRAVIVLILVLDVLLIVANWRFAASPDTSSEEVKLLRRKRDLMAADIRRAELIRSSLPSVQTETQNFYQKDLRPAGGGYSSMSEDLGSLAKDAGLQITSTRFREHEIEKRGVDEITISISLVGPYPSVVSFINGLERSNSFYLLDSLQLDSSAEGVLKLNLELRTYFRS
jgi:Tfp pilus assembly protein PilO